MAREKVFRTPEEFGDPPDVVSYFRNRSGDRNVYKEYEDACDAWSEKIAAWCRERNPNEPYAGKTLSWGVADGSACYMVLSLKPLQLLHLPFGDGYRIDAIMERGLRAKDVKDRVDMVERARKFNKEQYERALAAQKEAT